MKKQLLFFFLALFFINSVLALDCQYTKNESYEVEEEWFYFDGEFEGVNLNVNELVSFENNHLSFIVYNNLTIPIKVELNYTLRSEWFGINTPTSIQLEVEPRSSESHQEERISSGGSWASKYWVEKFEPTILEPRITSEWKIVTKQREICKLCGNEICLNDGASCNPLYDNSKCGSGICNIAGFCGIQKIIDCPNGKLNCQDKICLKSSTKEEGESYMCSFECKSDRFENGTCLKSSLVLQQEKDKRNKNFIIFGVIVLIISLILIAKFALIPYIKKRKKEQEETEKAKRERKVEEERRDKAKKDYDDLIIRKEEIEKNLINISKNLEDLEKEKEEIEKNLATEKEKSKKRIEQVRRKEKNEIKIWKDKKKNASIEAQKEIDKKIAKIKKARENKIKEAEREDEEKLNSIKKSIKQKESLILEEEKAKNILKKSKEEKEKEIMEIEDAKPERRIERLKNKYQTKYCGGGSKEIIFDEKGEKRFMIKYVDGNIRRLSKEIYKSVDNKLHNKHIHHIDGDELNDVLGNLIALPSEEHEKYGKFTHYKIRGETEEEKWQSGIQQLKEQLDYGTEEKPFPEHIQEEFEKRRKEEISDRHVRTSHRRRR